MKMTYHEVADRCTDVTKAAIRIMVYASMDEEYAHISDQYIEEVLEDTNRLLDKLDKIWEVTVFCNR